MCHALDCRFRNDVIASSWIQRNNDTDIMVSGNIDHNGYLLFWTQAERYTCGLADARPGSNHDSVLNLLFGPELDRHSEHGTSRRCSRLGK